MSVDNYFEEFLADVKIGGGSVVNMTRNNNSIDDVLRTSLHRQTSKFK
jgi:hypothetical protein